MNEGHAPATLTAAFGTFPGSEGLRGSQATVGGMRIVTADVPVITRAFAPMVRNGAYDLCELAIGTFLQAKANGKPIVLLPVVLAARFQEPALVCRSASALRSPAELKGRRIGSRSYSQTTAMWVRGLLQDRHRVRAEDATWVVIDGPHVSEATDPAWVERAPPGADLMAMLRDGSLDAVVAGDMPEAPDLRTVFPDPEQSAKQFEAEHGFTPINHMLAVSQAQIDARPALAQELTELFGKVSHGRLQMGLEAVRPGVALALRYATQQGMLARRLSEAEVWAGLPELGDG